ncbi:hypothetical protein QCM80_42010 [Bradyrhizobium sp. SSUT112]|uniref:hypothetical protein n=1 Tax=Bradyrhizobium sp. SSUT112 TaxID=3040604 RepID=UPI0024474AA7|nr:hypothetical protein [Bradyrhizobium sp. SSUT112]MDH2357113.1 hypothetical protein [Bradyrhizobium sp. SSUT112]
MDDDYYFVWVLDRAGKLCPQVWSVDQFDRPDWQVQHVVTRQLLSQEQRTMQLDRLAKLYPAPS